MNVCLCAASSLRRIHPFADRVVQRYPGQKSHRRKSFPEPEPCPVLLADAHLRQKNAFVRHFLLGWITSLLKRPGLDMVSHSPLLLDGLFAMLTDSSKEIR